MATNFKPNQGLSGFFRQMRFRRSPARVFSTQQEAFSFVQRSYNEAGGATDELRKLHAEFVAFQRARENQSN